MALTLPDHPLLVDWEPLGGAVSQETELSDVQEAPSATKVWLSGMAKLTTSID
jgi:hypothetical protein